MRSKIEWLKSVDGKLGYTVNPVKGLCPMACSYCYARRMYKRFHWDKTIRFDGDALWQGILQAKSDSKIFMGSTMELFGKWVNDNWMNEILQTCKLFSGHTFIFLTKQPYNLRKWNFPDNCWVGVSTTGFDSRSSLEDCLGDVKAKVKFVSIEPLLDYTPMDFRWVNWVIVGRCTPLSGKTKPHINWIADIIERADAERIPVFLKDNLKSLIYTDGIKCKSLDWALNDVGALRQEFPKLN